MGDEGPAADERRVHGRLPTEIDVALSIPGGAVLDSSARAVDVGPAGFKAITKARLAKGLKVSFILTLGPGDQVSGRGEILWTRDDGWGGSEAGTRITSLAWGGGRRLRRLVYRPGYDFFRLARIAAKALFLLALVLGLQNILLHQPHIRDALFEALPAVAAALVMAAGLIVLLRG